MGSRKLFGILALAGGVLVLLICMFADSLGLGGEPGFGWKQVTGSVVGAVVAIVALFVLLKKG